jgi:hypothetical protein
MRKTSVRKTSVRKTLARELQFRDKPVTELRPLTAPRVTRAKRERIFSSMEEVWSRMSAVADSTKIIKEDRDR